MPAYVIFQGDVTDPATYEEYKTAAAGSVAAAGGRYIVRGGELRVLEGAPPGAGRVVVLEFPSRQAALDWYHGDAYQRAKPIRERAADSHAMWLIDGA